MKFAAKPQQVGDMVTIDSL